MNAMHTTQFDHASLDLLLHVIWSRVFWPSVTWNFRKAQRWSKSVLLISLWNWRFVIVKQKKDDRYQVAVNIEWFVYRIDLKNFEFLPAQRWIKNEALVFIIAVL